MKTSRRNSTGENRGNGEGILCSLCFLLLKSGSGGVVELDFDKSISDGVNMYANPEGFQADFVFPACRAEVRRRRARDTASLAAPTCRAGVGRRRKSDEGGPYIDNRPLLVANKPELREYKAVYVSNDAEIGLFSDEVVVNCAP